MANARQVERGAESPRAQWRILLESYAAHHRKTARDSFLRLIRQPFNSAMTWLVMGVVLALPVAFLLLLGALQSASGGWEHTARITLYLDGSVDNTRLNALTARVGGRDDVLSVEAIPRDEALAEFREATGLGNALDYLRENPLPHSMVVTPAESYRTADRIEALVGQLSANPWVDEAQVDLGWLQRLNAIVDLLSRGVWVLASLLAVALVLVIGNTIRLAIESRRDEILVSKLVGGTNGFVRRPFLYTGLWYGLGSGLVAWIIIGLSFWWLGGPVERLAMLYNSEFMLEGLSFSQAMVMLAASSLLGWLGAWLAVKRHLDAMEPSQIELR